MWYMPWNISDHFCFFWVEAMGGNSHCKKGTAHLTRPVVAQTMPPRREQPVHLIRRSGEHLVYQ